MVLELFKKAAERLSALKRFQICDFKRDLKPGFGSVRFTKLTPMKKPAEPVKVSGLFIARGS
ncbi:hypothetical protein ACKJSM_19075 [Pseudomonas sp. PHC1]|uniref:hypothetical protein n=1 Tax=Pseudomonas sp. PHC1 TaxID=3384759 RepID=UPI00396F4017